MYVTKRTEGSIKIKDKLFVEGERHAISTQDFAYLKKTFPNLFDFEGTPPPKETTKPKATKRAPKKSEG